MPQARCELLLVIDFVSVRLFMAFRGIYVHLRMSIPILVLSFECCARVSSVFLSFLCLFVCLFFCVRVCVCVWVFVFLFLWTGNTLRVVRCLMRV